MSSGPTPGDPGEGAAPRGDPSGAASALQRFQGGLAGLSVRRAVTFFMIYLVVAGFGVFSLSRLRLDMFPDVTFPMMGVITLYEGANPQDVEELITRRIEEAVAAVEGVEEVSSTSKYGVSVVNVKFAWGTDLDMRELDVRKSIGFIEGYLPTDANAPLIFAFDPSMQPILFLGVRGPYSQQELREIAERQIEPLVERVPGVASAVAMGGLKREIQVTVLPERLQAYSVSVLQVIQALRASNLTVPGGAILQGGREFPIETMGHFESVEDIGLVVVGVSGLVPVYLRDVAEIKDTHQEINGLLRNDRRPGLMMMVRKQSGANTVQTVRRLRADLPRIIGAVPEGIELSTIFDQAEIVEQSLGNLSGTALQAFVLAGLVLLFFLLNVRTALIVATAIPVSVLASFGIMDQANVTLNIISMAGLALAVGMLVDNSIVVVENIFRHIELGRPPREAAVLGTGEVAMAITASTLTTVAVFAPILFVPGIAGVMFRDMAVTICFSLAASLVVALTLIPLATSRLLEQQGAQTRRPNFVVRGVRAFLDGINRSYGAVLDWCLGHRALTLLAAFAMTVGAGLLGFQLDVDFMPKSDQSLITLQVEAPVGSNIEEMDAYFRQVEDIIEATVPERATMNIDVGGGDEFVALFTKGKHAGVVRLKLKPLAQRKRRQREVEKDLRQQLSRIPGVKVTVLQPRFTMEEGDIVIEIYGHDLEQARALGKKLVEVARATPGTADVSFSLEEGTPEFQVRLDRERIAALGLNPATIASTISALFKGTIASLYREGGSEYNIRVRAPRAFRSDVQNLRQVMLSTPTGKTVPLSSVASVRPYLGPMAIQRKSQQRVAKVAMNVPGSDLGGVIKALEPRLAAMPRPEGFSLRVAGTAEDLEDSFISLGLALLVAIALVYMVMASQFESLIDPFIIIFSIPLAGIGVVLSLYLTDTPISVTAAIGVIVLAGVVVNNAIVLVDFVNQLRSEGANIQAALQQAGRMRLRPILMTAATTILAMLPMAMELGTGAETWAPLARTVIGGLAVATALTTLVVPVVYSLIEGARAQLALRWRSLAREDAGLGE